ncbi:MAG: asparagine synthase (glutamine-hydrolyzing) [Clostridium sp.]
MCGFITLYRNKINENDKINSKIYGDIIRHRGPDDTQDYIDDKAILSFKRLSIVDLEFGRQPFNFKDKFIVVFNGEIYNYKELRDELKGYGYEFHTNSEIEVICSLYDKYNNEFVKRLRGMFSIAIYDKINDKFVIARDNFGIKPLYYIENNDYFITSSEFKVLVKAKEPLTYTKSQLGQYLTFQYIPGYDTLFNEIKQLPPGFLLEKKINEKGRLIKYFEAILKPEKHDRDILKQEIVSTIKESVKSHMISDVPVAAFLSSGIDSSIIVKLASEITSNLTTFSIGFNVDGYDETQYAKRFCNEFGIKNESIKLDYKDYIKELPRIIYHMDNPIADPSIIPLYYICKRVSKDFKVVLSGEGSDEFFGGYNIYTEDNSLKYFDKIPKIIKSALLKISYFIPENIKGKSFIERGCTCIEDRYVGNARIFSEKEKRKVLKDYNQNKSFKNVTEELFNEVKDLDNVCKRQYVDIKTWLIGDILTKADRMSMANSLEVRVPFLDREVFNLASTLTKEEKINGFTTKYMLREAFKGILPEYVYEKKKLGYPVPIRVWLKDELYDWAYEIIRNNPIEEIDEKVILKMLKKHKRGKGDYSRKIWAILVYIIWYRLYIDKTLNENDKFII